MKKTLGEEDSATGGRSRWAPAAILLLLVPIDAFAQAPDYRAELRDATQRYRGDVPTEQDRSTKPLVIRTVEEVHRVTLTEPEPFAVKPFSLQSTLPRALIPLR